jgi:hypothetical protein
MEEITRKFFETTEPCPKEIPDCANLRQEYIQTLDSLKRKGGCNACAERQLKNTFTARIAATVNI